MLKVVCFLWKRIATGYQLPAACDYDWKHVEILQAMVKRHLKIPHEFICITDHPNPPESIKTLPIWDKCRNLGGCFNRLYAFSEDMQEIIGGRFVMIDLDCVIVREITPLFDVEDDFKINEYAHEDRDQYYNGGLILMDPGARRQIWDQFDPEKSPEILKSLDYVVGSDQAWIRYVLGKGESRFTEGDGVYNFTKLIRNQLPGNARMVFFAGKRDPSTSRHIGWVRDHWRI